MTNIESQIELVKTLVASISAQAGALTPGAVGAAQRLL